MSERLVEQMGDPPVAFSKLSPHEPCQEQIVEVVKRISQARNGSRCSPSLCLARQVLDFG